MEHPYPIILAAALAARPRSPKTPVSKRLRATRRFRISGTPPFEFVDVLAKRGHESRTVPEAGWAGKQNGELLKLAENRFDVFVTVDTNLRYPQNLERRRIAIVILDYSSNRLEDLRQHSPACASAPEKIKPGEIVQLTDT